ncbi:MAG: LPS export ABC transporter permease LptG [Alphaproteobacteria bacterium]|nr:LPS export ABC transporter permease LptG [Alphaproteobacteria bacterium]
MAHRLSSTTLRYIARQYTLSFAGVFGLFVSIVFLIDTIELLRRASGKENVSLSTVLEMALFKLPHMAQELLPFAILFGAMLAFWRLNRNSELIAIRAFGVSVWQFLFPILVITALIGGFKLAVFNPLAATLVAKFEQIEGKYLRYRQSVLAISKTGLWLRQNNPDGQAVIHASAVSRDGFELTDTIVFFYEGEDKFVRRADAGSARLMPGYWELQNVWLTSREEPEARFVEDYQVPTELTLDKIQESFASPKTISFWQLPQFIRVLDETGFSTIRHRLHFHALLAEPLLLCAMTLIAAVFSLRHNRRTGGFIAVAGGVSAGFLLYFLTDVVSALGLSAAVPIALAAWTPALASTLLGLSMLFHLEDG